MLKRLPGPPMWAQMSTGGSQGILSSLKDHLWQRRGDYLQGNGGLEPTSTHLSHHWDGISQRERQGTSGE